MEELSDLVFCTACDTSHPRSPLCEKAKVILGEYISEWQEGKDDAGLEGLWERSS